MPRSTRGFVTHRRHAALLERTKGFRNGRSKLFKRAKEADLKAQQYAYRDRRTKKRDFRRSWIMRINAAVRLHGMTYGTFIAGLTKQGIAVNRKQMADLAISDPAALKALVDKEQPGLIILGKQAIDDDANQTGQIPCYPQHLFPILYANLFRIIETKWLYHIW
jgi:large subunit ribosomal protein L20